MNRLYIATHKPFFPPSDPLYAPIQVGAHASHLSDYLTDDTGDNISSKNHLYGELTALYWIWKNDTTSEHIGLCHYRRYFLNSSHQLLTNDDCEKFFNDYDIILPYKAVCPGMNYYEMFARSHNVHDLNVIEDVIARTKPEYLQDYQQAIHSDTYYMGNLFITSRELFNAYVQWLFEIFDEAEPLIDVSSYDQYHQRVYGFLSEQMLMAWVNHHHLRVCELEVAITSEKAETTELISDVFQFIGKNDVDGAIAYYSAYLKKRPDVRFEASDVGGRLPLLELALDIFKSEDNNGLSTIATYKDSAEHCLAFVKNAKDSIHRSIYDEDASALHWLMEHNISWIMMERILENDTSEQVQLTSNLNKLAMLLAQIQCYTPCLQLLQYALKLNPTDSTTLRHTNVLCSSLSPERYTMNVAIATNRRYVPVSMVMLYSLFFNNTDADIHVYIFNCELTEEDRLTFEQLATAWNQKITLLTITDVARFEGLPTTEDWTKETYFRLMMPELLPDDVERILYLDVDTIINKPIRSFYETDFAGMDLVVCEDIMLNRVHKNYYQQNFSEMADKEFTYFNAGVILWNLAQIRKKYTFDTYREKLLKYLPVLQCLDQDILNVVHCGCTLTVDWRLYNLLIPTAIQNHFSLQDVSSISCIIHFLGPKPWDPSKPFEELYQIWKDYEQLLKTDSLT